MKTRLLNLLVLSTASWILVPVLVFSQAPINCPQLPIILTDGPMLICQGGEVTLTGLNYDCGPEFVTFTYWSQIDCNLPDAGVVPEIIVSPDVNTNYYYTVRCSSTVTNEVCEVCQAISVNVIEASVPTIFPNTDSLYFCSGDSVDLIVSHSGDCTPFTQWYYSWAPDREVTVLAGDTLTVGDTTTTIDQVATYIVRDSCFGCVNSDTIVVVIVAAPDIDLNDTLICPGDSLILRATDLYCPRGSQTIAWFNKDPEEGGVIISNDNVLRTGRLYTDTSFVVMVSCSRGGAFPACLGRDKINVRVGAPSTDLSDTVIACSGAPLILDASSDMCDVGITNHRWLNAAKQQIGQGTTLQITVTTQTTIYLVTSCGALACADTDVFVLKPAPRPEVNDLTVYDCAKKAILVNFCVSCPQGAPAGYQLYNIDTGTPITVWNCETTLNPGTYQLSAWCGDFRSCSDQGTIVVDRIQVPGNDVLPREISVCRGDTHVFVVEGKQCKLEIAPEKITTTYFWFTSRPFIQSNLIRATASTKFTSPPILNTTYLYMVASCTPSTADFDFTCADVESVFVTAVRAPAPQLKDRTICRGDSLLFDLRTERCASGVKANFEWHKDSLNTTPISTDSVYSTGVLDQTTNYWLKTGCGPNWDCPHEIAFKVDVAPAPLEFDIPDLTICLGGKGKFDAAPLSCRPGERAIHDWYNTLIDMQNDKPTSTGPTLDVRAEKPDSFWVVSHCGDKACADTQKVYLRVTAAPSLPEVSVDLSDECIPREGTVQVTFRAINPAPGAKIYWRGDFPSETAVASGVIRERGTYIDTMYMEKDNCTLFEVHRVEITTCLYGDTDTDGILDIDEDKNQNGLLDPEETDPFDRDTDDDGLSDGEEDKNKNGMRDPGETSPSNPDTDLDGLPDGLEVGNAVLVPSFGGYPGTDPNSPYAIIDANPYTKTNPTEPDTDGDGIIDGREDANANGDWESNESNPLDADTDDDGIRDGSDGITSEYDSDEDGTPDVLDWDSDNDGLSDGLEQGVVQPVVPNPRCEACIGTDILSIHWQPDADPTSITDHYDPDTDNDGCWDGAEDTNHNGLVDLNETDPNDPRDCYPDFDGDGIPDHIEDRNNNGIVDRNETDLRDADTDDDGISDGDEDIDHDGYIAGDINKNRIQDNNEAWAETDPLERDTDKDGIPDGIETGVTKPVTTSNLNIKGTDINIWKPDMDPSSRTNPVNANSDGDGCNDGEEDSNRNGSYEPEMKESDPNDPTDCQESGKCGQKSVILEPNPFFPEYDDPTWNRAVIQFSLCASSNSPVIKIYTLSGKLVRQLDRDLGITHVSLNKHFIAYWTGEDEDNKPLPPGSYIWQIEAPGNDAINGVIVIVR